MAGGDRIDNAALDDFIGDFAARPVANGPARRRGRLTGQDLDLAPLVRRNPGWRPGAGQVFQALFDAQVRQGNRLEHEPAFPPPPSGCYRDIQLVGDLGMALTIRRRQHDPRS
jgi:hypothetical protein